eukprot:TRINITY_DN6866_c0_g4_i1.p2 TRINITY_DN6866_c0_g4~~TRINITY_DN6866_c0_g4_i1.p2  ORF type:complete len:144 (-),score=27.64 TRINITY_DN6866_c0_g4_i1:235-666(-)
MAFALVLFGLAFIAHASAHDDALASVACQDRPVSQEACEDDSRRCYFREGIGCFPTSFRRLDAGARDSKGRQLGGRWMPAVMLSVPALFVGCCLGYIALRCCRWRRSGAKGAVSDVEAGNVVIGVPIEESPTVAVADGAKQVE